MPNPSPTLVRCTTAEVSRVRGGCPALVRPRERAIVKHPAWAAPRSSSGLVPGAPSKRVLKEYGPSKAPLPRRMVPLPARRSPLHLALAVRSMVDAPRCSRPSPDESATAVAPRPAPPLAGPRGGGGAAVRHKAYRPRCGGATSVRAAPRGLGGGGGAHPARLPPPPFSTPGGPRGGGSSR